MARTRTGTAAATVADPPVVEPLVEQVVDGDEIQDVAAPAIDYLNDREWLYAQVTHRLGCPMMDATFKGTRNEAGRSHRMEHHDATEPRRQDNPMPRTYRIIRCVECGNSARIKLPRDD